MRIFGQTGKVVSAQKLHLGIFQSFVTNTPFLNAIFLAIFSAAKTTFSFFWSPFVALREKPVFMQHNERHHKVFASHWELNRICIGQVINLLHVHLLNAVKHSFVICDNL